MLLTAALIAAVSIVAPARPAAARAQRRQQQQQSCVANQQAGADLGEKINACDRLLGAGAGEIVASPGGPIKTQVTISGGHTLRLRAGVYPSTFVHAGAAGIIRLKSGARIVGAGQEATILEESSEPALVGGGYRNHWTVIINYEGSLDNYAASSDIHISDLQVRGAATAFNSATPTVQVGNCHNCSIERVTLDGTRSLGLHVGGGGNRGNFADGVVVRDCVLRRVASQAISVVNGANVTIERNRVIAPGGNQGEAQAMGMQNLPPGNVPIDVEPNSDKDTIRNLTIRDNLIDASDSPGLITLHGIVVQNAGIPDALYGPVVVEGNRIIGARLTDKTNHIAASGVWINGAPNTRVVGNYIQRAYDGVRVSAARNFEVARNQLVSCGFTANTSIVLEGVLVGRVVDNRLSIAPDDALAAGNDTSISRVFKPGSRVVIERNAGER